MEKDERIVIFINGPFLNRLQDEMKFSIDHRNLRDILSDGREISAIHYFTTTEPTSSPGFQYYLTNDLGFSVTPSDNPTDDISAALAEVLADNEISSVVLVDNDEAYANILVEGNADGSKSIEIACRYGTVGNQT